MAVHCSSNVILLAIEYFIDSKGERQNIKLLSTQNNYSPSFGLKKLVIFFISSDKTDKKLCRSWKYKTHCRTKRRGGQGTTAVKRLNRYFCFLLLGFHLPVREKWAKMYKSVSQHRYLSIFLKILSFFC